jgi:hypothetical protein
MTVYDTNDSIDTSDNKSVLPGGATYTLKTNEEDQTSVTAITYSTLLDTESKVWQEVANSGTDYDADTIATENYNFITSLKSKLDSINIVQYTSTDTSTDKLSESSKTSMVDMTNFDAKYQLVANGDDINSADLDILTETYTTTIYKVFTDVNGNVYVAEASANPSEVNKSTKDFTEAELKTTITNLADALSKANGDKTSSYTSNGVKVTVTLIGSKSEKATTIISNLKNSGDSTKTAYYRLDLKTKVITNAINSVTRNKGSDTTAVWSSDSKWYNEAYDGIYVVMQKASYNVGFGSPNSRMSVLYPDLCPKKEQGTSDLFTTCYLSQFASYAENDSVGTFFGMQVTLPDIDNMYRSKIFYIPNANVQDIS